MEGETYYAALYRISDNTSRPQHVVFDEKPTEDLFEIGERELR